MLLLLLLLLFGGIHPPLNSQQPWAARCLSLLTFLARLCL